MPPAARAGESACASKPAVTPLPDGVTWVDGRWRVSAAWATGTAHVATGTPRQDGHAFGLVSGLGLVIAVSDGAGSAALSQHGAAAATAAVLAEARDRAAAAPSDGDIVVWRDWLHAVAGGARAAVEREAAAREAPLGALACTLIVTVATPERIAVAQVGDGAVVAAFRADGGPPAIRRLTLPENGEHVNLTSFLTGSRWEQDLQTAVHEGTADAVAAFTDGLQLLLLTYPEREPNEPFFRALFGTLGDGPAAAATTAACVALLGSERVRGLSDDDLTLVVAAPVAEIAPQDPDAPDAPDAPVDATPTVT